MYLKNKKSSRISKSKKLEKQKNTLKAKYAEIIKLLEVKKS
jgi:hypothetical protein